MTGHFFLDWAAIAVSLFNTILLLWLGLTVLLNAERRTWGLWLAGGGLLAGAAFFVSHSAILGHGSNLLGQGLNFWWHAGWGPVIALPLIWYLITLWYSGFWEPGAAASGLRRQRPWFVLALVVSLGLAALVAFANPLPSFAQAASLSLAATPSLGGVPVLILAYPAYIVLCISLSLDALRRPGPSARVMGDLARRRARPWLMAAAVVLLAVSLLVASIMLWVVEGARAQPAASLFPALTLAVGWFDLAIAALIAVTVLLVGQAVAAYEVFTGRTLPRRGLLRHWRSAVVLAAGYGLVAGWSLTIHLRPIYGLLLTAVTLAVFFALFGWRSYAERELYIRGLRPFVASQHLYDDLLAGAASPSESDLAAPFRALCRDVLGARGAYLAALGPLAPLVPPLRYPEAGGPPPERWTDVAVRFHSPQTLCLPLDPGGPEGGAWAVPLWSERGLIGLLRLEAKADGGPYSQEEIEIARASGERLIDTRASAEMARRLMGLQRQRLVESQVLDRRARRVLHDDTLPRLHAAMLALSAAGGGGVAAHETLAQLGEAHHQIADLLRDLPGAAAPEVSRRGLFAALRQLVEDELGRDFAKVTWEVAPEAERVAQALSPVTAEVLFYAAREAVRNAARYGRRPDGGLPRLRIQAEAHAGLQLAIEDDGAGADGDSKGGSGQGLALHSTLLAVVGGTLSAESLPQGGWRITLSLPAEAVAASA